MADFWWSLHTWCMCSEHIWHIVRWSVITKSCAAPFARGSSKYEYFCIVRSKFRTSLLLAWLRETEASSNCPSATSFCCSRGGQAVSAAGHRLFFRHIKRRVAFYRRCLWTNFHMPSVLNKFSKGAGSLIWVWKIGRFHQIMSSTMSAFTPCLRKVQVRVAVTKVFLCSPIASHCPWATLLLSWWTSSPYTASSAGMFWKVVVLCRCVEQISTLRRLGVSRMPQFRHFCEEAF